MGTAAEQGAMWGARAQAWADSNEPAWTGVFEAVMERVGARPGQTVLDMGCGAGGALAVARARGATVAGLDASEALAGLARHRLPGAVIAVGDMEALPFPDESFDAVTAINSVQFAGDGVGALREARRVVRDRGVVAVLAWGRREDCEMLSTVMPAVFACLPPATAAPPASALSEPGVIEGLMEQAGLSAREASEVPGLLAHPDLHTATEAILAASARAIAHSGEARVRDAVQDALRPAVHEDGTVRLENRFRLVLGDRR